MREELLRAELPADDDVELNADVSLRPRSLADFVGQRELTDNLEIILEAARRRPTAAEHVHRAEDRRCGTKWSRSCSTRRTAYERRISYWSSDVCSSDLHGEHVAMTQASRGATLVGP